MQVAVLGVDLGKNSCSVVGLNGTGEVVLRRRMRRDTLVTLASSLPPCIVAMEACCGAHHLGRLLAAQGHSIRLMSPEYVRPYVKAQKNDDRDAEAIAEAATRPTMRFVELKAEEQLDLQSLHRVRSRLVTARTALINQLRAILLERGHVIPKGRRALEPALAEIVASSDQMSGRVRRLIEEMREEWTALAGSRASALTELRRCRKRISLGLAHERALDRENSAGRGTPQAVGLLTISCHCA